MSQKETMKIPVNQDTIVTLMYDSPKTGTNNFGAWYLYGLEHDGKEVGVFATETLHGKLKYYQKGDVLNIRKEEYASGKFSWNVIPQEGTKPKTTASDVVQKIDDRTHDIHKQVCLKLAVELMGEKDAILTGTQLDAIEANMKQLLMILEGEKESEEPSKDDMPF